MDEKMICVPYGDFVDGVKALADLASIRALVTRSDSYCSKDIKAILGLEDEKNA
jgi:hypothetical protein